MAVSNKGLLMKSHQGLDENNNLISANALNNSTKYIYVYIKLS